jgi:hypothetical protein
MLTSAVLILVVLPILYELLHRNEKYQGETGGR